MIWVPTGPPLDAFEVIVGVACDTSTFWVVVAEDPPLHDGVGPVLITDVEQPVLSVTVSVTVYMPAVA